MKASNARVSAIEPKKPLTALDMLNQSLNVSQPLSPSSSSTSSTSTSSSSSIPKPSIHKPILVAPIDSRYVVGTDALLTVKLLSANKLRSNDGKSEPFVRIRQADYEWNSKQFKSSDTPEFNETVTFSVVKPSTNLLLIEVLERDKVGRKHLLGFTVVDLSLIPKDLPVTTTEKLSGSATGEITICLKAVDFGLENIKDDYLGQYLNWRSIIPPVGRREARRASAAPSITSARNQESGRRASIATPSSPSPLSYSMPYDLPSSPESSPRGAAMPAALSGEGSKGRRKSVATVDFVDRSKAKNKVPGPYGGRSVPGSYSIENGYVRKNPSPLAKMFRKLQNLKLSGLFKNK